MALPQLSSGPSVAVDNRPTWRFRVSLQEEEATVVSFKKLVRDAERSTQDGAAMAHVAAGGGVQNPGAKPALPLALAPPSSARDLADGLPPSANRFSSVIEKIERYYTGHQSEEEEDSPASKDRLGEETSPPQKHREDDFYDTDDSFIDDDDLDAYFSDQGEPEHQGFVVTKGLFKPRAPRPQGNLAESGKPMKKRPRLPAADGKGGQDRQQKVKKEGGKGPPANKGKARERAKLEGLPKNAKVVEGKPGAVVNAAEKTMKGGGRAEETAALVLPVMVVPPSVPPVVQGVVGVVGVVAGDESKGPTKSEGPEAVMGGGASRKVGKKQLLSDKVQRALQVSKEREDAAAAAKRREADARRAVKKKGEKQKTKKTGEGDASLRVVGGPEGTAAQGSLVSATVSGVPIGLLNAEVSNARTPGSRPVSKKRPRLEEESGVDTQGTGGPVSKKVKVEPSEGATEEGHAGKARKPRATDSERLDAAIEELTVSVAELCPPAMEGEADEGAGVGDDVEDGGKKKRLPQQTQAALSKVAKVAGMRKGYIPREVYQRLLPIVGHVLKEASLKMNLKRALVKALEAKKGGVVTPKKEPARKSTGGTPRRKEEAGRKKGEALGLPDASAVAVSPTERAGPSATAASEQTRGQPSDVLNAQRLSAARQLLEAQIRQRMQGGEGAASGASSSPGGCEGAFQWDHAMENALLAVVRAAKEGTGEQNGQVAKALYRDLTQLWPSGDVGVGDLQKAIRRAKSRVENKTAGESGRAGAGGSAKRRKDGDGTQAGSKKSIEMNAEKLESSPRAQGGADFGAELKCQEQVLSREELGKPQALLGMEATHLLPSIFKQIQTSPSQTVL